MADPVSAAAELQVVLINVPYYAQRVTAADQRLATAGFSDVERSNMLAALDQQLLMHLGDPSSQKFDVVTYEQNVDAAIAAKTQAAPPAPPTSKLRRVGVMAAGGALVVALPCTIGGVLAGGEGRRGRGAAIGFGVGVVLGALEGVALELIGEHWGNS